MRITIPETAKDKAVLFHGTSMEAARKIKKQGFNARNTIWNDSFGDRTYMVPLEYDVDRHETIDEDITCTAAFDFAVEAGQCAAAYGNSKCTDVAVLMFAFDRKEMGETIWPDMSNELMQLEFKEITDHELNRLLKSRKADCWLITVKNAYCPLFRPFYIPYMENNLTKLPDDVYELFEKFPAARNIIINNEGQVYTELRDFANCFAKSVRKLDFSKIP